MTDPTPTPAAGDATPAMRRKADLMVGLFVAAAVALLGGVVVLVTGSSAGLGIGLIAVAVAAAAGAVVLMRSFTPEDRARLTAPRHEGDAGSGTDAGSGAEGDAEPEGDPAPDAEGDPEP